MIFRTFFLLFTASVRSRPPGPPAVPGVFFLILVFFPFLLFFYIIFHSSFINYPFFILSLFKGCPITIHYPPNRDTTCNSILIQLIHFLFSVMICSLLLFSFHHSYYFFDLDFRVLVSFVFFRFLYFRIYLYLYSILPYSWSLSFHALFLRSI